jgi:cellulose synthase/poly-beta-1,6-N-acetylglucosamine synthase-like glycosyltransferase
VSNQPDPDSARADPSAAGPGYCPGHGALQPYSAPPGLRLRRPPWLGVALLLSFAVAALGVQAILPRLTFRYGRLVSGLAGVQSFELPKQASIAIRPLTVTLLVLFALFAAGSARARIRLAATALAFYLPSMFAVDVALARLARDGGPSPFMTRGNICAGVVGIIAACLAVFLTARLPASVNIKAVIKRPGYYVLILLVSLAAAVISIQELFRHEALAVHHLALIPLLGGVLSALVLFFAVFPMYLCLFGYIADHLGRRAAREAAGGTPGGMDITFGFLVPAHNEEGRIGDCIRAIDTAAGQWPGGATIYVIENGSSDGTYEEARAALAACRHARGRLLTSAAQYPSHAKAHALNTGLAAASERVLVRVDADTFVSASLLPRMAPHFEAPQTGGVGTVPLPHKTTIWIERMRAVEVYYGAAFKRTSQGAVDAIPVLPGATVAFRRDLLLQVGGFSEGMLGEDADITVRVGRLGYRIVSDPMIRVYSEQPQNLRELREQRMRWSFGLFHMIARNRAAMYRLQGLRGVWTMPWACFVMFRKLMLIPFGVAALGLIILDDSLFPLHEIAAAGAIALGAQLIVMAVVVTVLGGPQRIISLPSYVIFRLIVTYFALETLLTVPLKEARWTPYPPGESGRHRLVTTAGPD